jgi:hypothetical protein
MIVAYGMSSWSLSHALSFSLLLADIEAGRFQLPTWPLLCIMLCGKRILLVQRISAGFLHPLLFC